MYAGAGVGFRTWWGYGSSHSARIVVHRVEPDPVPSEIGRRRAGAGDPHWVPDVAGGKVGARPLGIRSEPRGRVPMVGGGQGLSFSRSRFGTLGGTARLEDTALRSRRSKSFFRTPEEVRIRPGDPEDDDPSSRSGVRSNRRERSRFGLRDSRDGIFGDRRGLMNRSSRTWGGSVRSGGTLHRSNRGGSAIRSRGGSSGSRGGRSSSGSRRRSGSRGESGRR
jgi:hypothetical protein